MHSILSIQLKSVLVEDSLTLNLNLNIYPNELASLDHILPSMDIIL